jgi:hypothetical protein
MLPLSREGRWRKNPAPFVFLNLAIFLFFNNGSLGETVQRLSVEELARQADTIVRGRVQKVSNQQTADRSNMSTHIEVSVIEQWKGRKLTSLVLNQPGGSAGGITQAVPGLPHFSPGEEVILFLEQMENGYFQTVGGSQGKLLVQTDPQTRKEFTQDLTGKSQSLEDFLNHLRAAL